MRVLRVDHSGDDGGEMNDNAKITKEQAIATMEWALGILCEKYGAETAERIWREYSAGMNQRNGRTPEEVAADAFRKVIGPDLKVVR
jgi:hypothetical protein